VIGFVSVLAFVGDSPTSRSDDGASTIGSEFSVKSVLPGIRITAIMRLGPKVVQVKLRNAYDRDVTAVVASVGDEKFVRVDYIYAELEENQKLAAGMSDEFEYGFEPGDEIVITAVVFGDLTSDGDYRQVRKVIDKRLGMKIQLRRINRTLQRLDGVPAGQIAAEVSKARRFADNLPIETDGRSPLTEGLEHGLRTGRTFILRYLNKLESELNPKPNQGAPSETLGPQNQSVVLEEARYQNFRLLYSRVRKDFSDLQRRL
jgi:hypothetical protein